MEPQFEGQTKGKLGNAEVKGYVESAVAEALTYYLEEHPAEARRIIEKCLTAQKAREAARKARDMVLRTVRHASKVCPTITGPTHDGILLQTGTSISLAQRVRFWCGKKSLRENLRPQVEVI